MIKEISVRPKPQNKNAKIVFLATMFVFLALLATYIAVDKYKGIIGIVAIGFLSVSILVYTKYISPVFYYDITEDSEGTPVFVVRQIIGKRQQTLCRVDLADIKSAEIENREERKKHKTPGGVLKYNYGPTLNPDTVCRLSLANRYEKSEIIIEVSEEYLKTLLAYAEEARARRAELDEEEF